MSNINLISPAATARPDIDERRRVPALRDLPVESAVGGGSSRTLLDIFASSVARWPGNVALEGPDATFTYSELEAAACAVAARLRAGGVGRGDRVVVRIASGTAELYVAILGVLAAGAAYVPVDHDDPPARADQICRCSAAVASIGDGLEIEPLGGWHAAPAGDDREPQAPRAGGEDHLGGADGHVVSSHDDAWIIFTSGSTGAPKGVAVHHGAAAAFVDAETLLWEILPSDRVLAGLSVGFDASCEEIWLAWAHGAALVPAPRSIVRAGTELGTWLLEREISVVSTVPTLAALWDESCLHDVRLLILGGEACPQPLGWRLAAGREVWNTYGPTEATVVSTAAPIIPGEPITIGWPLRGWKVAVMDGEREVAPGEVGELVIGGTGLARYLDPELDAGRYPALASLGWARAYRTGDVVRSGPGGLEFVGRQDDQVKIGGRRIELGEIEAVLQRAPSVRAAAVAVRESGAGNKLLVGYVVGGTTSEEVRAYAARLLPAGIVPLVIQVAELPMTASGKLDRRALPWPAGGDAEALAAGIGADGDRLSDHEVWVAERWVDQLGPVSVTPNCDFFALGGTSLAAAKLISTLRTRYPAVAVADLYKQPTLRTFAARLEMIAAVNEQHAYGGQAGTSRRCWAGLLQMLGLCILFGIQAVPWFIGALAYGDVARLGTPYVPWYWLLLGSFALAGPVPHALMQAIANRILLRDLAPGRYSRYSSLATRLWFVDRLADVTRNERVAGTPWADRYARMIGANIGAGVRLGTIPPSGALLHVGEGATIEGGVDLRGWWIERDELVVGLIEIGSRARVATRALLSPGAVIGAGAEIEPGSVVSGEVPAGERWGGVPAVKLGMAGDSWPSEPPAGSGSQRRWRWLFGLSLIAETALLWISLVPTLVVLWLIGDSAPTLHSPLPMIVGEAAITVPLSVTTFAILVALTLRLVWRVVRPGWYDGSQLIGWALWFGEELKTTAATILFPLYASVYTRAWLRLMGIEVGKRTEVSTATGLNPLVSYGAYSQSTDDIGFCGVRARDGWLHVSQISIGDHTFLGPGAIVPGGTRLGDDSLIGALTLAPTQPPPGTSWFGVPALELPRIPEVTDPARTVDPSRRLIVMRGCMDLVRLFGPNTLVLLIDAAEVFAIGAIAAHLGIAVAVLLAPSLMFAGGVVAAGITVALKWLLIGRYRRSEHPLWSWFVWRDELINASQEQLAGEMLLGAAIGMPLMALYLRAMGARVGRGCWIESLAVTEYEMIELQDGAAVNRGACLMTHLFHDRLLRIGPTRLEAGASLGPTAAVLPDTVVGAGTVIGPHSVLLRGEELPSGTRWHGAPLVAE